MWNDFGGKPDVPGNVIGLVQALEKCLFREALVILHRDFIQGALAKPREEEKRAEEREAAPRTETAPAAREPAEKWSRYHSSKHGIEYATFTPALPAATRASPKEG